MEHDVYRKLMKHLGSVGIGYPQYDEFLAVLEKKITPEEAETAVGLPTRLPPLRLKRWR
ncbi:MAG: hypothetical protein KAS98_15355 [Deltaproteobacteria bacterium]|nr:hypothetical protein [Deltaproteobacteria bacterium]